MGAVDRIKMQILQCFHATDDLLRRYFRVHSVEQMPGHGIAAQQCPGIPVNQQDTAVCMSRQMDHIQNAVAKVDDLTISQEMQGRTILDRPLENCPMPQELFVIGM